MSIYAKHPTGFSGAIHVCSQNCKCGLYNIALGMCLRLQRAQKMMALKYAGKRQAKSSKLGLQLRAVPSSLTSTYKLFILPLHALAIGFHVPTSAKYDCSAYLLVSQKGKEAHLQSASRAKGQSTTSVLSAFTCLNFDFLCLLLLCHHIKGKCELKITANMT